MVIPLLHATELGGLDSSAPFALARLIMGPQDRC